ncbi:butirosin biosynthesis protein H-like [Haloactinospora alba]|uniref:Butirosin biosynthesis protein H-like n=1 Tax=Haloactinospora alba TaxID=405555 RepID=A0A543N968_9ACTN|nr:BtrH N-terminal domain-containing protein [Haloactinospora alba]TQN28371.1 butirosin biosynthesis protein H-like [Haloactinospora alba]
MTTLPAEPSLLPAEPSLSWYDDLCSCLQLDIGHVLERAGWDPVQALGSSWRFHLPAGPVEPVEYFHPAGERLQDTLCGDHPVRLRWHHPSSPAEAHRDLRTALERGTPAIVAVNNFHLPFRPAYRDVHAAHLVIVTGYDPEHDVYRVIDPVPPSFSGNLPRAVLQEARGRISLDDESDPFFAGSNPSWRWLEVGVSGPQPEPGPEWVYGSIRANTTEQRALRQGPQALSDLLEELRAPDNHERPRTLREIYILGWPAQAEASLHSAFLTRAARRLGAPDLAEAAHSVDRVAHAWTGFRVAAAHEATSDRPHHDRVTTLGRRLRGTWEECLEHLERVAGRAR